MLQLRGCYSASPCPLDTGLARLIVYQAFWTTPNASWSATVLLPSSFGEKGGSFAGPERVWIAGFS